MACEAKILHVGEDALPHPEALLTGWVDDVSKWPSTQSSEVVVYLLETPSEFDRKALKAYKSTKAYSYYQDGWVKTCYYHNTSDSRKFFFIKANVLPSFKINENTTNHGCRWKKKLGQ